MLSGNCAWNKRADDEGFTLVEILVASAIMFFVATALFGLVSTSTLLSVTAKADAVAVNTANSFLEQVRRLAYSDVTQARLNTLAMNSSRAVDGVAVSIAATVTPQWLPGQTPGTGDPGYKHVVVTVRATPPAGRPFVLTTGTFVSNLRDTGSAGGAGPRVELTAETPRDGAVWGSVLLGMTADSGDPGSMLTRLEITAGGNLIAEEPASGQTDSLSGYWNTTATNIDGTLRFPDGIYSMRARAWNDRNQLDQEIWNLTVDNHPPDTPGTPTVSSTLANTAVTFDWSQARDGSGWARDYLVDWKIQSATSSSFSTLAVAQISAPTDPTSLGTWTGSTTAFRRYMLNVAARGPVPPGRTSTLPASATFISRPSFTATTTVNVRGAGANNAAAVLDINLGINAPAFQVTGPVSYRWQYRYNARGVVGSWRDDLGTTAVPTLSRLNWTLPANGRFRDGWIEFRCLVTLTPSDGSVVQVPSAVVRFTGTGTGLATRGVDDWSRWSPSVTPDINWGMWTP